MCYQHTTVSVELGLLTDGLVFMEQPTNLLALEKSDVASCSRIGLLRMSDDEDF